MVRYTMALFLLMTEVAPRPGDRACVLTRSIRGALHIAQRVFNVLHSADWSLRLVDI